MNETDFKELVDKELMQLATDIDNTSDAFQQMIWALVAGAIIMIDGAVRCGQPASFDLIAERGKGTGLLLLAMMNKGGCTNGE